GMLYLVTDYYKSSTTTSVFVCPNGNCTDWIGDASPQSGWTQFHGSYLVPQGVTSIKLGHTISDVGYLETDDYTLTLSSEATAFPKGMVTLTFDDGWQSFWDVALPTLNTYNLKATSYVITGADGSNVSGATANNGYMNKAELTTLYNSGFDIED